MKQFKGVQRYINLGDCDAGNFPATAPTASGTKPGTPATPTQPPTGSKGEGGGPNTYPDQAADAAIKFSNQKVGYFKIDLYKTKVNMYGESTEKWYYPPVEVRCLIDRGEFAYTDTEYGPDVNQTIKVTISKIALVELNFTPEVGDIITDQEKYYQVNTVDRSFITIPGGGTAGSSLGTPGQIILYTLGAYLTRTTTLNLIQYS
jgi:hypothetical protein